MEFKTKAALAEWADDQTLGELLNELNSHFVSNLQSKKLPDGHHLGRSGARRSPEDFRSASAGKAGHGEWQHRALPDSVAG
jgi:hypothetical protein